MKWALLTEIVIFEKIWNLIFEMILNKIAIFDPISHFNRNWQNRTFRDNY